MMVTVRDILASDADVFEKKLRAIKAARKELSFLDKAILVLGSNCPRCKELVESSDFKEFLKAALDRIMIVFDEEGYLFGADYSNVVHILERRVGNVTPAIVYGDEAEIVENSPTHIMKIAKRLGIPMVVKRRRRSKKSEEEVTTTARGKKSGKRNTFVEMKQIKKELKKAALGCSEDFCVEV